MAKPKKNAPKNDHRARDQPPRNKSKVDSSLAKKTDPPGATAKKDTTTSQSPPTKSKILNLEYVVGLNGANLTRTLGNLIHNQGRRSMYTESDFEKKLEVVKTLLEDPKGALRLRVILAQGLQQGAKKKRSETFWPEFLSVVDTFLGRIEFPRTVTSKMHPESITPDCYRDYWDRILNRDNRIRNSDSKSLLAAQEIMLLDAFYAFWKSSLSSEGFLKSVSLLQLPEGTKDQLHQNLPWDFGSSLATNLPAPTIVAQANTFDTRIEELETEKRRLEVRIGDLENELSTTSQELNETQSALEEESTLLLSANETIEQLRNDVKMAGSMHRHRADEIRSRYKGQLEGELDRHLRTIQRAAEMNPPRSAVIIERVETLIGTLKTEIQWLEDLG